MHNQFFELLRVSVGSQDSLSENPTADDWKALFKICKDQALLGVCFDGVNRLPESQMPPQDIIIKWMGLANTVRNRNMVLNDRCGQVMEMLSADGFHPVILKGQGNALMYPNPLSRQCGDIDVWLDGDEEYIKKYVTDRDPRPHDFNFHHIDYHCFPDVEVEMHFALGKASDTIFSKKFYKWFSSQRENDFPTATLPNGKNIVVPSLELNLIHQLVHIDQHFGPGGVGLRQIMDYYFLLKYANREKHDFSCYRKTVKQLGLRKMGESLMYVLGRVLGLQESEMPLAPNKKHGEFLLNEIINGGNFGNVRRGKNAGMSKFGRRFRNLFKSLRFIPHFPGTYVRHYYKATVGLLKGNW